MERQTIGNQLKEFFRGKTLLSTLIVVNVVVWLFTLLFGIFEYLFVLRPGEANSFWMEWFALSSKPADLLFHPWTLVTYMFLHSGFVHLLFNMVMLYCAGLMCARYMGMRRFGWTYFLSGVSGALFYLLFYNLFPVFYGVRGYAVGASAAVMGIFAAVATYMPDQEVGLWPLPDRFRIKMKWLAVAFIVMDFMSIPKGNAGGHIAHIGGMVYGFLSVWAVRKGWFDVSALERRRKERRRVREEKRRQRIRVKKNSMGSSASGRPESDEAFNKRKADNQKRVDAILDKISKSGYDSLTKEEKAFLFNYKS